MRHGRQHTLSTAQVAQGTPVGQEVVLPLFPVKQPEYQRLRAVQIHKACWAGKDTRPQATSWGGNRKVIQNKEDLQEANLKRLFNALLFFLSFF